VASHSRGARKSERRCTLTGETVSTFEEELFPGFAEPFALLHAASIYRALLNRLRGDDVQQARDAAERGGIYGALRGSPEERWDADGIYGQGWNRIQTPNGCFLAV
jgi:hypothetical protein